ncbi:DUF819 family protein [Cyanobium sp. NIES-981]|uniref:DUF819 family protein n=1 Tax=Cyanobium sp. NIES-981 TaxID=1851505 RepID=UPI0007DDCFDE|nr:DUF819 family protein [Cyanobium sp. NIES-981]SBO42218.1 conserved membrane protein of unknown function [Cyanobium sp. NIES-981]
MVLSLVPSLLLIGLLTVAGWWLAERTPIGRQLGMTLLVLFLGLLATNLLGWRPDPAAEAVVNGPLTSLAIALLLLAVDLRRVWPGAQRLLGPFAVAVLGAVAGTALGGLLLRGVLGSDLAALSGLFTATFSGGSLNFVSVARTLRPPESLVLIATAADHVVFSVWFLISLALGRGQGPGEAEQARSHTGWDPGHDHPRALLSRAGGAALLWGVVIVVLSQATTGVLQRWWAGVPGILVLTTIALVAAQVPAVARARLSYPLGLLLIQPFFTVIGLSSPVQGLLGEGRWVLLLAVVVVATQAACVLLVGRWRGWPAADSLVGCQAAVGGPSTALALAGALRRPDLALPGVAIGLLGYLVGTYLGLAMAAVLTATQAS